MTLRGILLCHRRIATTLALLAALLIAPPAAAHEGPPYPVLVDQKTGPYTLSLWADPDVGTGTFYAMLDGTLPETTTVRLWVQPADRRIPEVCYTAKRRPSRDGVRYVAETHFETQGWWRVRIVVQGPRGAAETETQVEVTPPGLGAFDLVLYAAPFLAVAFLWFRAAFRRRAA
jgi:hypothetical protein